jgi:hypothetical protein
MRFAYLAQRSVRPIASLGGSQIRHRPILPIHLIGPSGSQLLAASLDSGSDDTLFPLHVAARLGIDLANAVEGEARSVGGPAVRYAYAPALLRLADGSEACEWRAIVGFVAAPLRWAILGHAGFLQFFDVQLLGERREVLLAPNSSFTGRHVVRRSPSP